MKTNQIKLGLPFITDPNCIGEIVKQTPKQLVIKLVKRTFEPKSNSAKTITQTFTKAEKEWFTECFIPREMRFWKATGKQVGCGEWFIVNHELVINSL